MISMRSIASNGIRSTVSIYDLSAMTEFGVEIRLTMSVNN